MIYERFLSFCAIVGVLAIYVQSQNIKIPPTRFTCRGRASGYYADIDTGCQVYHMCDGLGRQFSYSCPNTTLFQQRMLICDHWYMVNCTNSESDYDANLLIGQRDKPFVSEAEMRHRTPRPDILSVPLSNNYYEGLKEAETKFPLHPGNSIVGTADTISNTNNNGLDGAKQNYRPPTSWSTGTSVNHHNKPGNHLNLNEQDILAGSASQEPQPTYQPTPAIKDFTKNTAVPIKTPTPTIPTPSQELSPPAKPTTTSTTALPTSEEFNIDARMQEDPVINFINRFDPNSPDSFQTAMTKEQIENINKHLPLGQSSAEDERTPRKNKNTGNNFNVLQKENNKETKTGGTRYDSVNIKSTQIEDSSPRNEPNIPTPSRELLPPKKDFDDGTTSTMGPPIYYEWKWAVPAFDLEPPKFDNATSRSGADNQQKRNVSGQSPFSTVTRPTPKDIEPTPSTSNTEYNISSYFVPDYIFPLDKPHPGYENDDAHTSFQVKVPREGRAFGENPNCPQCHPAYLKPGTCEPCIVNR